MGCGDIGDDGPGCPRSDDGGNTKSSLVAPVFSSDNEINHPDSDLGDELVGDIGEIGVD